MGLMKRISEWAAEPAAAPWPLDKLDIWYPALESA